MHLGKEVGSHAVANVGAGAGGRLAAETGEAREHGVEIKSCWGRQQLEMTEHEKTRGYEAMRAEPVHLGTNCE